MARKYNSQTPKTDTSAKAVAPAPSPKAEAIKRFLRDNATEREASSLVAVGKVLKPHGVHGEIRTLILTDFPERFEDTDEVYLVSPQNKVLRFDVEGVRDHANWILLKLVGMETPEEVALFRDWLVSVPDDDLVELEEGEFWHFELIGLPVYSPQGELLGTFKEVIETPGYDLYAITTPEKKELLIPAIDEFIKSIDLKGKKIIALPPAIH